jgi:hypothetical protein
MKRWLILPVLIVGALSLAAIGFAGPTKGGPKGKPNAKGGKFVFQVVRTDHGCETRPWATDTLRRVFKVRRNGNGTYTVRIEDNGRFVTLAGPSPSADPCPGVIRRGKHGSTLLAGMKGKLHGYVQGTVSGGTFNPNGTCTATCSAGDFVAGFFTAGATFTCNEGYAGCRFNFTYTAPRSKSQGLLYHHWVDRGTNGVNEIFIGDIANT